MNSKKVGEGIIYGGVVIAILYALSKGKAGGIGGGGGEEPQAPQANIIDFSVEGF